LNIPTYDSMRGARIVANTVQFGLFAAAASYLRTIGQALSYGRIVRFAAPFAHRDFFLVVPSEGIPAPLTSLFSKLKKQR
jgi:pyruvate-formate lyase